LLGGVDSRSFIPLRAGTYASLAEAKAAGVPTLNYGVFIQAIMDFVIIAFAIFMVVKAMNAAKEKEPAAPPPGPSDEVKLLTEIRDLLKVR
jgi:large conductance mechanosensitive channel